MFDGPQWTLLLLLCNSFREILSFYILVILVLSTLSLSTIKRSTPRAPSLSHRRLSQCRTAAKCRYPLSSPDRRHNNYYLSRFQYAFTFQLVRERYRNDFHPTNRTSDIHTAHLSPTTTSNHSGKCPTTTVEFTWETCRPTYARKTYKICSTNSVKCCLSI